MVIQHRNVVFVWSIESGRVALLGQPYIIYSRANGVQLKIGHDVDVQKIVFKNSDQNIKGVVRTFWSAGVTRDIFRELLFDKKTVLFIGAKSPVLRMASEAEKALVIQAGTELISLHDLEKTSA